MRINLIEERDTAWERHDPRFRLFIYAGPENTVMEFDISAASIKDALDTAAGLSDRNRNLWSLALMSEDSRREQGLIWLTGMDYNESPTNAAQRRQRKEMQVRYLMARSLAKEPLLLPNGHHVIRMFPEWGVEVPLWESFSDNRYPFVPGSLEELAGARIDQSLEDDLTTWNREWTSRDELDETLPDGWVERGWALHTRVQEELRDVAEVHPEFD